MPELMCDEDQSIYLRWLRSSSYLSGDVTVWRWQRDTDGISVEGGFKDQIWWRQLLFVWLLGTNGGKLHHVLWKAVGIPTQAIQDGCQEGTDSEHLTKYEQDLYFSKFNVYPKAR